MRNYLLVICIACISFKGKAQFLPESLDGLPDSTLNLLSERAQKKWANKVRSDVDSAIWYALRGIELAELLHSDSLQIQCHRRASAAYAQAGNQKKAREHCTLMIPLLQPKNTRTNFAYHLTLGIVEFNENNYQRALEHHLEALELAKKGNHTSLKPTAYTEISRVFDRMEQPEKALEYALLDVHHALAHGNDRSQFLGYYNLAIRYMGMDSFERGLEMLDTAQVLSEKINIPVFTTAVKLTRGTIYTRSDQPNRALPYSMAAMTEMKAHGDERGYLTAKLNVAKAYQKLAQYQESVDFYQEAVKELEVAGYISLLQNGRKDLAISLRGLGQSDQAYDVLNTYYEVYDSLQGLERSKSINELEIKYQTAEKENQILSQEIVLSQRTRQRNNFLMLAISAILFLFILYFFQRAQNKKNLELARQAEEIQEQKIEQLESEKKILSMSSMIEGQEAERRRIAKDLHDGLGGLLTTVKTHLGRIETQIEQLEELDVYAQANHMIDQACHEVRRISQNMIPGVLRLEGLNGAVEDITARLKQVHSIQVDFDFDFDPAKLTEAQSHMIYRIIQECCNNIVKHSQATEVLIQVMEYVDHLNVLVEDNGVGFNTE